MWAYLTLVAAFVLGTGAALAQVQTASMPSGVPLPLRVGVAVFLNDAGKVNEAAGTYEASIDVRLRWRDPSLAFDAKEFGGDRQEFNSEQMVTELRKMWNPRLTLANMVGTPSRTDGGLFIYANGTVEHIQRLRLTLDTKYRLNAFPFDTQALGVRLLSTRYTQNQIALVQDQSDINASGIKENLKISGWKTRRVDFAASANRGWNGDTYPEISASFFIQREPYAHLFALLIPFLLTLLVPTIMTLYVKADIAPRMTLWGASILALIALNFTFSVRYSALGGDSLVQQLITIGFGYQLLMIAITSTFMNPQVGPKLFSEHVMAEIVAFLRWSVPIGLLALIVTRALLTAFS